MSSFVTVQEGVSPKAIRVFSWTIFDACIRQYRNARVLFVNGDLGKQLSCKAISFIYGRRKALSPIRHVKPYRPLFPKAQVFIMDPAIDECSTIAQSKSYSRSMRTTFYLNSTESAWLDRILELVAYIRLHVSDALEPSISMVWTAPDLFKDAKAKYDQLKLCMQRYSSNGDRELTNIGQFELHVLKHESYVDEDWLSLRSYFLELPGFELLRLINDIALALPCPAVHRSSGEISAGSLGRDEWWWLERECQLMLKPEQTLMELLNDCDVTVEMIGDLGTRRKELDHYTAGNLRRQESTLKWVAELRSSFEQLKDSLVIRYPHEKQNQQKEASPSLPQRSFSLDSETTHVLTSQHTDVSQDTGNVSMTPSTLKSSMVESESRTDPRSPSSTYSSARSTGSTHRSILRRIFLGKSKLDKEM